MFGPLLSTHIKNIHIGDLAEINSNVFVVVDYIFENNGKISIGRYGTENIRMFDAEDIIPIFQVQS